jgi:hypothetical protein
MYHKPDSKFFDKEENKRIYTSVSVTPETLLKNCHPVKYRLEGKSTKNDEGNIVKRINELDDNNIFYVWKCGYPKNYMFVLERDVGLWRFYNPNAYVTPKTIRKILLSTNGMCNAMFKILQENGDKLTVHDVRKLFCEFVDRMVQKMHPDVYKGLDRWDESRGYKEYLYALNDEIKQLDPYQGLEEDEHFRDRLPLEVKLKLDPKPKKKRNAHKELEAELAPKDDSLVKQPKKRRKRTPVKDVEAQFDTFKSLEPLKNSTSFYQYYRAIVKSKDQTAEFHEYKVELGTAAVILDTVKEANHNEMFLRSWIGYFIDLKLKGNNIKNKDKTSLRALQKTYDEYNNKYIGCGV